MTDPKHKTLEMVKTDLDAIESALEENLNPYLELVSEAARHILFSGGKRFRPLLMILSARLCRYQGSYDTILSTAFEYLHAATLLHDDLVDGATLRRGKKVAHALWGNSIAILVGDFLLARSLSIAAKTGRPKIIQVISKVTEHMSQGEIHQMMRKGSLELSENEYLEVITNKTAFLIQGACHVGAIIADAAETEEQALADYGLNLGIAFQMADDLLDYTADTSALGKKVGADLREGKLTLPVIFTLQRAEPQDRRWMETLIQNNAFSIQEFEQLQKLLQTYGGIDYTRDLAAGYISRAKASLSIFEPSKTKELLLNLADYALAREA